MLSKIMAVLLALAVLAAGVLGWRLSEANSRAVEATNRADLYQRSYENEKRAVGALEKSLAAQKAASKLVAIRAAKDRDLLNQTKKDLDEALKANPDWASQPVPDSVWDSITR